MARTGRLTEVWLDGVGYIDSGGSDLLYSVRLADSGLDTSNLSMEQVNALNGQLVSFELDVDSRAINVALAGAAHA